MKTIDIAGKLRDGVGKSDAKVVRKEDKVPAVVYGHGDPQHIALEYLDVERVLYTPDTYIINLDVDGAKTATVIREAQFHPVTDRILHLDLMRISDSAPIEVELPIELVGRAKGVMDGGQMQQLIRRIKVRGIPAQLPEKVEVNVAKLELGKTIKVSDVNTDLEITTPSSAGIAMVIIPRSVRTGEAGVIDETGGDDEETGGDED